MVYEPTDYETLVDSPVFAGKYAGTVDLSGAVTLNMVADSKEELARRSRSVRTRNWWRKRSPVTARGGISTATTSCSPFRTRWAALAMKHHRSSENGVDTGYFTKWNDGPAVREHNPHELVHSWNGKFRRPEMLWTPDYRTPMQDSLLWVYEGQTQFWGLCINIVHLYWISV